MTTQRVVGRVGAPAGGTAGRRTPARIHTLDLDLVAAAYPQTERWEVVALPSRVQRGQPNGRDGPSLIPQRAPRTRLQHPRCHPPPFRQLAAECACASARALAQQDPNMDPEQLKQRVRARVFVDSLL